MSRRYSRRERIKQQYAAIAAEKLYSDVPPPTVANDDYGPMTGVSTAYVKSGRSSAHRPPPPPTDYTHVWQLPLPQPHDDVIVTSSSPAAYGVGSIDSRYYVLDHNHAGSIIPTNDDIQWASLGNRNCCCLDCWARLDDLSRRWIVLVRNAAEIWNNMNVCTTPQFQTPIFW